jgi:Beta-galactosidase
MSCRTRRPHFPRNAAITIAAFVLAVGGFIGDAAQADELELPVSFAHDGSVRAVYRFAAPVSGRGVLTVRWTDVDGRLVERRRIPLNLADATEVAFSLDAGRAVTVKNHLVVDVALDATDRSGQPAPREREATASMIVPPSGRGWRDFQIIMWQPQTPAGYAALKRLGVTAGMVLSDRANEPGKQVIDKVGTLLDADLRWYLENTATDFYSAYHRWTGDRPVNWLFRQTKRRYWANRRDLAAFDRQPSLSDPAWLDTISARLTADVRALRRYRPLFYNLGDEPGIADLSAFWDFDFSPASLAAMRAWLKTRYRDLARLNAEWGAKFRSWDTVVPMTTHEAIMRPDQNFAAWGDFKEWMDVAFARALRRGSDAIHAADPTALSAIEGGQIPGWGGYDYSRLATSVDAIELGDVGDNVEMVRSFNPNTVMLTTSFRGGAAEEHRVWRELLRGMRGLILWDPTHQFVGDDGSVGDRGRAGSRYFHEIRDGIGALLINSRRHEDPIAILYSPASLRIGWLLDRIRDGDDWSRRSASSELTDNPIRTATRRYARAIEHSGLEHRFFSAREIEEGELSRTGCRVLILPGVIALSARAAEQIRRFVDAGGTLIADHQPGIFDEHGRRRATPALSDLFTRPESAIISRAESGRGRAVYLAPPARQDNDAGNQMRALLAAAGVKPFATLVGGDGQPTDDVETYLFTNGDVRILALLRDPAASGGAAPPETVELALPRRYAIYDIRARRALGDTARLKVVLGPVGPVVLALAPRPVAAPSISGPSRVNAGDSAEFRIGPAGATPAALDILHIEVADPDGNVIPYYGRNLPAPAGVASYRLPLAVNDKPGSWTLRARDVLTGATATARLQVQR